MAFFDRDGRPAWGRFGCARVSNVYDERDNPIAEFYLGSKFEPPCFNDPYVGDWKKD